MDVSRSPQVLHVSWGHLEVQGQPQGYKDAKLFPGGSHEWDWRETGTRHSPGIQPADVEELLARGAQTVVLSRGMLNRLETCPETLVLLEQRGIATHVLQTEDAVRLYNSLCSGEKVGALIHSTC